MTEEHAAYDSRAREIIAYAYLHAVQNDHVIHSHELEFMKKIALKDGVIDDDEARAIHEIFDRVDLDKVSAKVKLAFSRFSHIYPREKYIEN
jgi:hypothetical protein